MTNENLHKLNLFFPQWQGSGPDLSPYHGGIELKKYLSPPLKFEEIEVSTAPASATKNLIFGYHDLLRQMAEAFKVIDRFKPQTMFTLGGGCDAGAMSIAYLNSLYKDNFTLIWFDGHGDLNTPQSSPTSFFYGMPVRHLLGGGDQRIVSMFPSVLKKEQVVMAGSRDLDPGEIEFIKDAPIKVVSVEELEKGPESLLSAVKNAVSSAKNPDEPQNIYIHIDLDVLDPELFSNTPIPTPNGIKPETLLSSIERLNEEFNPVGLGLFEYSPAEREPEQFIKDIIKIGTA